MDEFLHKLIDWRDFEKFVAELYRDADEVVVEHDVMTVGKSGARRQIDVLVHTRSKLHTDKIIVECKRWKDPVPRDVIDVLAASVEDLNANRGAIFTTKGYEAGAVEYAKSKGIDIFMVRDIREDEWGQPGRHILLYLQMFHSEFTGLSFENPRFVGTPGMAPPTTALDLRIRLSNPQEYPAHLDLFALDGSTQRVNLVKLLIQVRNDLLKQFMQEFNTLMEPQAGNPQLVYETRVKVDFANYPFRFPPHGLGHVTFESLSFDHRQSITQNKMEFDRAANVDFALVVENYITNQRNYASKHKTDERVRLSDPIEVQPEQQPDKVVKNGSVMKVMLEHYVLMTIAPGTQVTKTTEATVRLHSGPNLHDK